MRSSPSMISDRRCAFPLCIAVVIKRFVRTGGAERYAVEVTQRLLERGHKIDIYAREADPELTRGMTFYKVPDRLGFSSALSLHAFARESAAMVGQKSYDIVHSHDKGCPADVSTVHTFSFKRGMDRMSLIKKINEFVISPRAWLYLYLEKLQARSGCLAAVSEIIREDISACHGRNHGIHVMPPGVDTERFNPERISSLRTVARAEHGLDPDDFAVVFVGSEFRRKGLDRLIPALEEGMTLFAVGRGEKMSHYRSLAEDCGVADAVRFTGLARDVLPYYALADVVVLPSIAEAFGMTVLEGMACGLPVVTSTEAGCSFLIDSGKNGFVAGSAGEIRAVLNRLRGDRALGLRMGEAARKTALGCTWGHTADLYEKVCYTLVEEKEKGGN